MSGYMAILAILVISSFGGLVNGLLHYTGCIWPSRVPVGKNHDGTVKYLHIIGLTGSVALGAAAGIIMYFWIQREVSIFAPLLGGPTGYQALIAFFGGYGGTVIFDKGFDWFEKQSVMTLQPQANADDGDALKNEYQMRTTLLMAPRAGIAARKLM